MLFQIESLATPLAFEPFKIALARVRAWRRTHDATAVMAPEPADSEVYTLCKLFQANIEGVTNIGLPLAARNVLEQHMPALYAAGAVNRAGNIRALAAGHILHLAASHAARNTTECAEAAASVTPASLAAALQDLSGFNNTRAVFERAQTPYSPTFSLARSAPEDDSIQPASGLALVTEFTLHSPPRRTRAGRPVLKPVPLRLGLLLPLSLPGLRDGRSAEWWAAFNVSVDYFSSLVENNVEISPVTVDSTDDCAAATQQLLASNVHAVVGPIRSSCSIIAAELLATAGVPLVSMSSTATELSNATRFPTFFRIPPSDTHQGIGIAALVRRYGWRRVGVITTSDSYAAGLAESFTIAARADGVDVSPIISLPTSSNRTTVRQALLRLRRAGTAINLMSAFPDDADIFFAEAEAVGMTGAGWTWLGTDGSSSSAASNVAPAREGTVGLHPIPGSGTRFRQWLDYRGSQGTGDALRLRFSLQVANNIFIPNAYVAHTFDCVEAIVRAVNVSAATGQLPNTPPARTDARIRAAALSGLRQMNSFERGFDGAIGTRVFFDANGDGPIIYDVRNIVQGGSISVGNFSVEDGLRLNKAVVFAGGSTSAPREVAVFKQSLRVGLAVPSAEFALHAEVDAVAAVTARLAADMNPKVTGIEVVTHPAVDVTGDPAVACREAAAALYASGVHAIILGFSAACVRGAKEALAGKAVSILVLPLPAGSVGLVGSNTPLLNTTARPADAAIEHKPEPAAGFFSLHVAPRFAGEALASIVRSYQWPSIGLLATDTAVANATTVALAVALAADGIAIGATVHLSEHDAASPTARAAAVAALKRGNTAINVLIGGWTVDSMTAIVGALHAANMTGPGWNWLASPGSVSALVPSARVTLTGLVGLVPLRLTEGEAYRALVSYTDSETGLGLRARNSFTLLSPDAAAAPSDTALAVHDGIVLLASALERAILKGAISFSSDLPGVHAGILQELGNANSSSSVTGILATDVWPNKAGYTHAGLALVNIHASGTLVRVGSLMQPGTLPVLTQVVQWASGSAVVPSAEPFVRRRLHVALALPLSGDLVSTQVRLQLQLAVEPAVDFVQSQLVHTELVVTVIDAALPCNTLVDTLFASAADIVLYAGRPVCARNAFQLFPGELPVPVFLLSSASNLLGNQTQNEHVFLVSPASHREGGAAADLAKVRGTWTKVGILIVTDTSSFQSSIFRPPSEEYAALAQTFAAEFAALGGRVAAMVTVAGNADAATMAAAMRTLHAGGSAVTVLIGGSGGSASGTLRRINDAAVATGMVGTGWTWLALSPMFNGLDSQEAAGQHLDILSGMLALAEPQGLGSTFNAFVSHVESSPTRFAGFLGSYFSPAYRTPAVSTGPDISTLRLLNGLLAATGAHETGIARGSITFADDQAAARVKLKAEIGRYNGGLGVTGQPLRFSAEDNELSPRYDVLNRVDALFSSVGSYTPGAGALFSQAPIWASGSVQQPSDEPPSRVTSAAKTNSTTLGVALGVALGFALLMLVVQLRRRTGKLTPHNFEADLVAISGEFMPKELARSAVTLLEEVGSGQFGAVFKGTVEHDNLPPYTVAVKTLKEGTGGPERAHFLREAALMAQFHHPNILQLVGVCTSSVPLLLVAQYCENGSLFDFLRRRSGFLDISLTSKLFIARDICEGMLALSSNGIVHRDLSARNVLLDAQFSCKVADFGTLGFCLPGG